MTLEGCPGDLDTAPAPRWAPSQPSSFEVRDHGFIEVELMYNVVLISAVLQSDTYIHTYIYIYIYLLFHILFHDGLS